MKTPKGLVSRCSPFAQVPNARLGHIHASMAATLALRICLEYPFFIEGEASDYVDAVSNDVCKETGLHEL